MHFASFLIASRQTLHTDVSHAAVLAAFVTAAFVLMQGSREPSTQPMELDLPTATPLAATDHDKTPAATEAIDGDADGLDATREHAAAVPIQTAGGHAVRAPAAERPAHSGSAALDAAAGDAGGEGGTVEGPYEGVLIDGFTVPEVRQAPALLLCGCCSDPATLCGVTVQC